MTLSSEITVIDAGRLDEAGKRSCRIVEQDLFLVYIFARIDVWLGK